MNRSILIIICDFLLVSLLVFSSPDINKLTERREEQNVRQVVAETNRMDAGRDLAAVMRLALNEERQNREQLLEELARARGTLGQREKQVQTFQQELEAKEQAAAQLQQQQTSLQRQVATAQTNLQTLTRQLQTKSTEALITKEQLAAMEAEAKRQSDQAHALQGQLAQLARSNQMVLAEQQRLANQLRIAEVEKRHATEQAAKMVEEVKVERAEKAKLAEGVKELASTSGQLVQEIRENRPLAPNTIFNEFITNRVDAHFNAYRSGLFGTNRRKETKTVLASDGTNTFALCHVQDTPLTFGNPGAEWESLTGTLARNRAQAPIRSVSFHYQDPRVVFIPVSAAEARQLGGKIYGISATPFKFQDAVLVGAEEGYYGECRFQIDLSTPAYVKLDRSFLKGLFGKFNPSRGDLVFSKTGELLGIMANGTYCLLIHDFKPAGTIQFGQNVRAQHTSQILSRFHSQVARMPVKLH